MKALVLAAGLGTRLLPYTRYTPKPLFTIGGRTFLDIIICKPASLNGFFAVANSLILSGKSSLMRDQSTKLTHYNDRI